MADTHKVTKTKVVQLEHGAYGVEFEFDGGYTDFVIPDDNDRGCSQMLTLQLAGAEPMSVGDEEDRAVATIGDQAHQPREFGAFRATS